MITGKGEVSERELGNDRRPTQYKWRGGKIRNMEYRDTNKWMGVNIRNMDCMYTNGGAVKFGIWTILYVYKWKGG